MLARYVNTTNDQSILERALPLAVVSPLCPINKVLTLLRAQKELEWWKNNRTTSVVSPFTNCTYSMAQYAVNNTAPRPESYLTGSFDFFVQFCNSVSTNNIILLTDYQTAQAPGLNLSSSQLADLYAELASGAESGMSSLHGRESLRSHKGWDYCSRFLKSPAPGNDDLTTLVIRETIPVDLNSILCESVMFGRGMSCSLKTAHPDKNHILLAGLYGSSNATAVNSHLSEAATIREGILNLFWNSTKVCPQDSILGV